MDKWKEGQKSQQKTRGPQIRAGVGFRPHSAFLPLFLYFSISYSLSIFLFSSSSSSSAFFSYFSSFSGSVKWWQQMRALQPTSIPTCFSFQQVFLSFPTFLFLPCIIECNSAILRRFCFSLHRPAWMHSTVSFPPQNNPIIPIQIFQFNVRVQPKYHPNSIIILF